MKKQKGFTLIELLVVIAIIGLLSTLAVVALNNARQKSRDARRVADIKQIQTAMELFFNDEQAYPDGSTAGETCGGGTALIGPTDTITYMNAIPIDPQTGEDYTYTQDNDLSYSMEYLLEGTTGGIPSGAHIATPSGICDDVGC